ncbi:MAG TPA: hypothetical protein VHV10_14210, partial [Ktedonobacteraceae bacterium]|nr:hypothetical protein [Ktedonobacteraceae bacterium]
MEWILTDIKPRLEWRGQDETGITLEELPSDQQRAWTVIKSVQREEENTGKNRERLEQFQEEINGLYKAMLSERQKQREKLQEEVEAQKRLGKLTAREVERMKFAMDSFLKNDLSSHLSSAITNYFTAYPITNDIGNYFQNNPISSIPPAHEIPAWEEAIRRVINHQQQQVPNAEAIAEQVTRTLGSQLDGWKASITELVTRHTSEEALQQRVDEAMSRRPGFPPTTPGLSEERIQRMINTALAARVVPTSEGLTEEQVQQRINAALAARPVPIGITEEQVTERIEAALNAQREQWNSNRTEHPQQIVVHTTQTKQATEPYLFAGANQDIRDWILRCEDYFSRNPELWTADRDRIIFAIGRLQHNSKAQDFGTYYRRAMDGLEGITRVDENKYWITFVSAIKNRFLSSEEAAEAIIAI